MVIIVLIALLSILSCSVPTMPISNGCAYWDGGSMRVALTFDFSANSITAENYNHTTSKVWIGRYIGNNQYITIFSARVPGITGSGPGTVIRFAGFTHGDEVRIEIEVDGIKKPFWYRLP